jgi:hypothetical protein
MTELAAGFPALSNLAMKSAVLGGAAFNNIANNIAIAKMLIDRVRFFTAVLLKMSLTLKLRGAAFFAASLSSASLGITASTGQLKTLG